MHTLYTIRYDGQFVFFEYEDGASLELIREQIEAPRFSTVRYTDVDVLLVDDDGLLKSGTPLNIPASMLVRRPIYGHAVMSGVGPGGETRPPGSAAVKMARHLSNWWREIVLEAKGLEQDPYAYTNGSAPPMTFTVLD